MKEEQDQECWIVSWLVESNVKEDTIVLQMPNETEDSEERATMSSRPGTVVKRG